MNKKPTMDFLDVGAAEVGFVLENQLFQIEEGFLVSALRREGEREHYCKMIQCDYMKRSRAP